MEVEELLTGARARVGVQNPGAGRGEGSLGAVAGFDVGSLLAAPTHALGSSVDIDDLDLGLVALEIKCRAGLQLVSRCTASKERGDDHQEREKDGELHEKRRYREFQPPARLQSS